MNTAGGQDAEQWREAARLRDECWSTTQASPLIWRHIALGWRGRARVVTFKILEGVRAAGGTLARARTVCCTVARLVLAAAGGGLGG